MQDSRNKDRKGSKPGVTSQPVNLNQTENERLVERAAGGDSEAFGELYSIYLNRIYRYVFSQVKDKTAAEDITEDIFVKAWKAISSCKGKEQTFLPWLFRIAHNHIIDVLRKKQRELSLEMESVAEVGDHSLELGKKLEQQKLLSVIDCLPQNQRQVIILKFIEGLNNHEIGQVIHKNQGAIRVLQMRALATLRKRLKEDTDR
ncbi:RNA polymerase sigma factor [Chloroflexota bacterium]